MELGGMKTPRWVPGGRQGSGGAARGWVGVGVQDEAQKMQPAAPSALAVAFPFVSMKHTCGLAHPAERIIGCRFSAPVGSVAVRCVIHNQFT